MRVRVQELQGIVSRGAVHYAMQQPNKDTLLLGSMLGVCACCILYLYSLFNHPLANNDYLILYTIEIETQICGGVVVAQNCATLASLVTV